MLSWMLLDLDCYKKFSTKFGSLRSFPDNSYAENRGDIIPVCGFKPDS